MLHAQALACLMFTAGKVGHQLAPEAAEAARQRVVQLRDSFSQHAIIPEAKISRMLQA